jgi:hypothetical protein
VLLLLLLLLLLGPKVGMTAPLRLATIRREPACQQLQPQQQVVMTASSRWLLQSPMTW